MRQFASASICMYKFPILLLPALLVLLPALLPAQDPADRLASTPAARAIQAGRAEFQKTCGFCHGKDGRGGASGPDLIRSAILSHDVNGDLIGQIAHAGRPDRGMPAFQLTDSVVTQIAAFLHSEAKAAASVASRMPADYPLNKLLVGDASQGRTYFQNNCSNCHSPDRDLAHIAAKYKPFDLQTRIAFPEGAKPSVTVTDGSGQEFRGEEVYSDEFWIALRDRNGWKHTWPRSLVRVQESDPLAEHVRLLKQYSDRDLHNLFAYLETFK